MPEPAEILTETLGTLLLAILLSDATLLALADATLLALADADADKDATLLSLAETLADMLSLFDIVVSCTESILIYWNIYLITSDRSMLYRF
jgi:hypothetical protein